MKERQEVIDQEAVAADVAEHGLKGAAKFNGKSVVPGQGDTVIQRAVIFTDAVGPNTGRTTARFLYVEAFNKSTKRVAGSNTAFTGPSLALSYAGPDGVYSTRGQHGSLRRHRPDAGRVHVPPAADPPDRRLREPRGQATSRSASPPRRPPAAPPPAPRPSRSPSGSARTSRRTSRASRPSSSRTTRTRPRPAPTSTRWPRSTRS